MGKNRVKLKRYVVGLSFRRTMDELRLLGMRRLGSNVYIDIDDTEYIVIAHPDQFRGVARGSKVYVSKGFPLNENAEGFHYMFATRQFKVKRLP